MRRLALVFAGESKIAELDVFIFIQQNVFELQVSVNTRHVVYMDHSSDELGKDLLDLLDRDCAMVEKVVVQLVASWYLSEVQN